MVHDTRTPHLERRPADVRKASPRPRPYPPSQPPLPALEADAGFFSVYKPVLFFVVLVLIPVVGAALWFYSPSDYAFELTEEELESLTSGTVMLPRSLPPAGSPAASAVLHVESFPEVTLVYIDHELAGVTPYRADRLPSGWHTVSLEKSGYAPVDTLLFLQAEQATSLSLALAPLGSESTASTASRRPNSSAGPGPGGVRNREGVGAIQLSTDPARVPVRLDGETVGFSPLRLGDLAPGPHELTLILPGYEPKTLRVDVQPGQTATVRAALVPLNGTLSVTVRPWGSIYIDGDLRVRDTDLRHEVALPAGTHRVRVVHPVLGAREQSVEVEPGQTTPVVIDLN